MLPDQDVTLLLNRWADGDQAALDRLMPLLYRELHKLAKRYMEQQGAGHTLQTTAVVHEAYLKLAGGAQPDWQNRSHFLGVAAKAMRHVLVDHARSKRAGKRGGEFALAPLEEGMTVAQETAAEVVALDSALTALEKVDARKAQAVELRYFGGLSLEETAEALKISPQTVMRDWKFALAFLRREMTRGEA